MKRSARTGRTARWLLLLGITIGLVVVMGITGTVAYLAGLTGYAPLALAYAPIAAALAITLSVRHCWTALGFAAPRRRLPWGVFLLAALLPLTGIALSSGAQISPLAVLGFAMLAILVGFVEETLFRGVLLRAFAPSGVVRATVLTAVAFALAHTVTAISPDADAATVARTVAFALAFGVAAALITTWTASILPAILLHATFDFVGFIFTPRSAVLTDVVSILVCVALAVVLTVTMASAARRPRTPAAAQHPANG